MPTHRVYIDESGDHRYRKVDDLPARYLALTAVLIRDQSYLQTVQPSLEDLKRAHFSYDPDDPVVLTRSDIIQRRRWFGVLREPDRNARWGNALIDYIGTLPAQVFTVVMDKKVHRDKFGRSAWDPYDYSLAVLLNRIRGYLALVTGTAAVIAESRGRVEDEQLQRAYASMCTVGSGNRTPREYRAVYPEPTIRMLRKHQNVAGLQIADILCAGQKQRVVLENGRPLATQPSAYTLALNEAAAKMINQYGHYLLD